MKEMTMNENLNESVESTDTDTTESSNESEVTSKEDTRDIDEIWKSMHEEKDSDDPKEKVEGSKEAQDKDLFELKHGEEVKKVPRETMQELAQKGFEYNVKMAEYKSQLQELESQRAEIDNTKRHYEEQFGELAKIQDYALQNPQWLQFIKNQYEKVAGQLDQQAAFDPNNPLTPLLQQMQSKLNQFETRFKEEDERRISKIENEKDVKLESEINEYKNKNDSFDWKSEDLYGKNLEQQILNHAIENGIKSFRAAANDFLFDKHMKLTKVQAKEKTAKDLQAVNKLGIKGISTESIKKGRTLENIRNRSYESLIEEGLRDLGIK
jgi:hypothetical protein